MLPEPHQARLGRRPQHGRRRNPHLFQQDCRLWRRQASDPPLFRPSLSPSCNVLLLCSAWSSLLLSAIGETLVECEASVCGLTVSRKKHKCKIAVWISRSDPASRQALEEAMRKAIGPDVLTKLGLVLEWTSHRQLLDKEKLKDGAPLPPVVPISHARTSGSGTGSPKLRNLKVSRPPSFPGDSSAH